MKVELGQLIGLGPTNLVMKRKERYHGDGSSVLLSSLAQVEKERALLIYSAIKKIGSYANLLDDANLEQVSRLVGSFAVEPLRSAALSFGRDSDWNDPVLARVLHDVRGGALNCLVGFSSLELTYDDLGSCAMLARDHAKMMRNAFPDIDPALRESDERAHIHSLESHIQKWNDRLFPVGDKQTRLTVENHFPGYFSDRCLETSAVDRVVYNLANNAARFSASGRMTLTTFLVAPAVVRWVMQNPVSTQQREWLEEAVGDDPGRLFLGGMTRGGNGLGMLSCARFTADAFGLNSPEQAVEEGYVGARLLGDLFCCWFHWPSYTPTDDDELGPCD